VLALLDGSVLRHLRGAPALNVKDFHSACRATPSRVTGKGKYPHGFPVPPAPVLQLVADFLDLPPNERAAREAPAFVGRKSRPLALASSNS